MDEGSPEMFTFSTRCGAVLSPGMGRILSEMGERHHKDHKIEGRYGKW